MEAVLARPAFWHRPRPLLLLRASVLLLQVGQVVALVVVGTLQLLACDM
jgi:hypothetical protein